MLYGYPLAATAENWLHECLYQILQAVHQIVDAGGTLPSWPSLIPADCQQRLESRAGLRDRIVAYAQVYTMLGQTQRLLIKNTMENQRNIRELLSCARDCATLGQLPPDAQEPLKDIFSFAFGLLSDFEVRDRHYKAIYDNSSSHMCPFCGCEYLDAPGLPREDLDHYLAKSIYPFAAANLRNLAPMCTKCNQRFKLSQDILRDSGGVRRKSFDPYDAPGLTVSLDNSVPFAGADGNCPAWQIEFDPSIEETTTWEQVFSIRARYEENVLDKAYSGWLGDFARWCKSARISDTSDQAVTDAMERYRDYVEFSGFKDRAFLKAATFRMLLRHCRSGNRRVLNQMRDLVTALQ